MKKIFVNLFFVILVTFQFVYSQDIKVIQSQNGESFLYDISYAKWNNWGSVVFDTVYRNNKTVVFDSDSLIKYEIPQSFKNRSSHLFLSNDGDYVINIYDGYGNANPNSVEIFEKGVLKYSYRVDELIDIDTNWDTRLLFYAYTGAVYHRGLQLIFDSNTTEFEKKITQTPCYIDQDTIFLFTQTKELLLLDFKFGKIKKESFNYINEERLAQLHPASSFKPDFKKEKDDLKLVGDIDFEQTCANYFDMSSDAGNLYYHRGTDVIKYGLLVDSTGKIFIGQLSSRGSLDTDKIISFIDSVRFLPPNLPKGVDYYLIEKEIHLILKDLEQARINIIRSEEEYTKRIEDSINIWISADSLNGKYIPFDLYDCFQQLDKLITPRDRESIKNFEYSPEFDFRYRGLLVWIKDNWLTSPGKGSSTRLSYYFFREKGLESKDEISLAITDSYYKYLRNEKIKEKKIIKKIISDRKKGVQTEEKWVSENENYNPLQADTINGNYIPKDLEDCLYYLDQIISEKDIQALKNDEMKGENLFSIGFCEWVFTDLTNYYFSRLSLDLLYLSHYRFNKVDPCLILEKYRIYLQKGIKNNR